MLGALGFTPGQVVWALLVEQTALGVAASALGLAVAWTAIRTPAFIGPPDGIPVALAPLPAPWMALAAAVTVATVAVAAAVPAWRAGRVSPVAAVASTPPRGRLSRLARIGLLVRLPVPLVLGARDAFTRRLPAALTIVGVAIPMAMITIAMTCWTTLDGFTSDPGRIDLAAALTVYPGSESIHAEQAQLARDPQIAADYPGAEFDTLLPGATATFTARAMGTSSTPYPFDVAQGAMFNSYNEAIAGQGLLDLLHYNVGDWIEVTVDGVPMIFHIVGRTLDPDNNGDVLDFGLDALAFNGAADQPQFYSLVLKPGTDPAAARQQLLRISGDRLQVQQAANPADGLGVLKVVIVIAIVALAIIGLANLLTATAVGLGDHLHEAEVLAAIGLTPRQVMATLVVNTTILTAFGAAARHRRGPGGRPAPGQRPGPGQRPRLGHRGHAVGRRDRRHARAHPAGGDRRGAAPGPPLRPRPGAAGPAPPPARRVPPDRVKAASQVKPANPSARTDPALRVLGQQLLFSGPTAAHPQSCLCVEVGFSEVVVDARRLCQRFTFDKVRRGHRAQLLP